MKWEVDKVGIDRVGIDKVGIDRVGFDKVVITACSQMAECRSDCLKKDQFHV